MVILGIVYAKSHHNLSSSHVIFNVIYVQTIIYYAVYMYVN